jgi:DNA-binding XRE family transcriptional regulator
MLAVVSQPHTRIEMSGFIPDHLLLYLRAAFPSIKITDAPSMNRVQYKATAPSNAPSPSTVPKKRAAKSRAIPYQETSFYKELKQEATPAMTLKVMREYKNMTLSDLAKKSGISVQNLSAMEAGRRAIGKKSAVKIAAAIGCGAPECYC